MCIGKSDIFVHISFFQCQNGAINTHRIVLASISPFFKYILEEENGAGSDESPSIHLPDVKKEDMVFLLSMLYNGSLNMYKR